MKRAFEELEPLKLEDNFFNSQKNMECSMLGESNNEYKEPYMNKKKRRRAGEVIENQVFSI